MKKALASFGRATGGNVALTFVVVSFPVLAAASAAIDYSRASMIQTNLQAALDGAVLAGAASTSQQYETAAQFFDKSFTAEGLLTVDKQFDKPNAEKFHGTASATFTTSLGAVVGLDALTVTAEALAIVAPTSESNNVCMMALSTTANQALLMNSGANLDAPDCEVHVKSTANPAAIFNAGTTLDTSRICIASHNIIDNGGNHPHLEKDCATAADPYAGKVPEPASASCDFNNLNYAGSVVLDPGVYCGWFNFNAGTTVSLKPGTYVIKSGGWNVNGGTWDGNGVTFYYADSSKIQFNSGVAATLTAPTTGTYKGILMAEKEGLADSQFVFDDNNGFDMEGIVYLPSREVVFNSGSTMRSREMSVISRTMIFNGVNWNLSPYVGGSILSAETEAPRLAE